MKLLKNISLVYALQILAVLILFFYPNYTTQAALSESAINTGVKQNNIQFASAKISSPDLVVASAVINSVKPLWLPRSKNISACNVFNTKADENLKKEYHDG